MFNVSCLFFFLFSLVVSGCGARSGSTSPANAQAISEPQDADARTPAEQRLMRYMLSLPAAERAGKMYTRGNMRKFLGEADAAIQAGAKGVSCRYLLNYAENAASRLGKKVPGGTFHLDPADERRLMDLGNMDPDICRRSTETENPEDAEPDPVIESE